MPVIDRFLPRFLASPLTLSQKGFGMPAGWAEQDLSAKPFSGGMQRGKRARQPLHGRIPRLLATMKMVPATRRKVCG
jgi:hypothetical protein